MVKKSETKTKKKKMRKSKTEQGKQWKQSIGKGRGEGNGKPQPFRGTTTDNEPYSMAIFYLTMYRHWNFHRKHLFNDDFRCSVRKLVNLKYIWMFYISKKFFNYNYFHIIIEIMILMMKMLVTPYM